MTADNSHCVPPAGREPGTDPDDPYKGVDVGTLPDWWAKAVAEFRDHGLRPYRPPRLADGAVSPPILERLSAEHDVEVRFRGLDVRHGDSWGLFVDGSHVATVGRERDPAGYTRYELTSEELAAAVGAHLADGEVD